jgi:predicted dehydrogenase
MATIRSQATFSSDVDCLLFAPNRLKPDMCSECYHKIFAHSSAAVKEDEQIRAALEYSNKGVKIPSTIINEKGCLYLGGYAAVLNRKWLKKNNITGIVNTAFGLEMFGPKWINGLQKAKDNGIEFLELNWIDSREQEISATDLEKSVQFINKHRSSGGNVVVHCAQGKSRSTTCVLSYLMSKDIELNPDEALAFVKTKRMMAQPNSNFMKQLYDHHKKGLFAKLYASRIKSSGETKTSSNDTFPLQTLKVSPPHAPPHAPPQEPKTKTLQPKSTRIAHIAVIGAAWWSQGWHIPQLVRHPNAKLAAIVQRSEQPTAASFLNMTLDSKTQLRKKYPGVPMYKSCEELIADEDVMRNLDGVIICTAHSCHSWMGKLFLDAHKHVLMEKPMTVDVKEAEILAGQATKSGQIFMVNNTANYRKQYFQARNMIETNEIGAIHHVLCVMYSPLLFLFDDPANTGWVKPSGSMVQTDGSGNGFGWGQSSHVLAWVLGVANLQVKEVTAITHRSENSGADITDAALIRCKNNVSISFSASCQWPGMDAATSESAGEEPTGKHFDIKIFGSKGVMSYSGDDTKITSGDLEVRYNDPSKKIYKSGMGFQMENTESKGIGPESLNEFINGCRNEKYENGANQYVGLEAVKVLSAMYRSAASGKTEVA